MKQKTYTIKVTEEEENLIMGMRNYVKSYPNGNPEMLFYLQRLFDRLTDPFGN